jgi:hypothetical protein
MASSASKVNQPLAASATTAAATVVDDWTTSASTAPISRSSSGAPWERHRIGEPGRLRHRHQRTAQDLQAEKECADAEHGGDPGPPERGVAEAADLQEAGDADQPQHRQFQAHGRQQNDRDGADAGPGGDQIGAPERHEAGRDEAEHDVAGGVGALRHRTQHDPGGDRAGRRMGGPAQQVAKAPSRHLLQRDLDLAHAEHGEAEAAQDRRDDFEQHAAPPAAGNGAPVWAPRVTV